MKASGMLATPACVARTKQAITLPMSLAALVGTAAPRVDGQRLGGFRR